MQTISKSEKDFIINGIAVKARTDGRGLLQQRPFSIERGLIKQASGSCKLLQKDSQVLVGIKASIQDTEKGSVEVKVECSNFMDSREMEKLLLGYKKVVESMAEYLDLNALNIIPGVSWCIHIDVLILDYGGNILDAIVFAVRAALEDTRIASVAVESADGAYDYDIGEEIEALKMENVPLCASVSLIGTEMVVDCDRQEEVCAHCRINVLVNRKGHICGVFKELGGGFDYSVYKNVLEIATNICSSMFKEI